MGYDVHITRAESWFNSETNPISLEEWIAYVKNDPEMRLDNAAEVNIEGKTLRYKNDGLAVWTAYSGHGVDGNFAWFDYRNSHIVVKNPDTEILQKMLSIAKILKAGIIGDDGETYDEATLAPHPKGENIVWATMHRVASITIILFILSLCGFLILLLLRLI